MIRRCSPWVVALLALAVTPACSRGGGDGDGFRLEVDGRAEVVGDDARELDGGAHDVIEGEIVRMLEGDAVLELPGDRSVLLRSARNDRDATVIEVGATPDVREGDAVVIAADDARFTIGDVDVRLFDGVARVQRGVSATVAVYEGSADVRSGGRALAGGLPALRQLSVPATGVLPRDPVPLVYDEADTDPWDLRFIGSAIDLGERLDDTARGFNGQLGPNAKADAALLRQALPPIAEVESLDSLVTAERSPGESLIGAAIVVEAGADRTRWDAVFDFREAGARWGLVALDQRVERDALFDRIDDAVTRSPLLFAVAPSGVAPAGDDGEVATAPTSPPTTRPPAPPTGPEVDDESDDTPVPTVPPDVPPSTIPPVTLPPLPPEPPSNDEEEGASSEDPSPPTTIGDVVETVETVDEVITEVVNDVVEGILDDLPNLGDLL